MLVAAVLTDLAPTLIEAIVRIASALVFASVLRYFERREGRAYLRFWEWSWLAFAAYVVGATCGRVLSASLPPSSLPRFLLSVLSLTASYLQALWLLAGTYEFTRRVLLRRAWFWPGVGICFGIGTVLTLLWIDSPSGGGYRYIARVGVRSLVIGAAFIAAGVWTFRTRAERRGLGSTLLPASLVFYGVDQIALFWLATPAILPVSPTPVVLTPGYGYVDVFIQLLIGLGMLLWLLEAEGLERRADWRRLAESEERYRTLAESAPDAILTVNAAGLVLFANGRAAQMFGHAPAALHGMRLEALMPDEQARVLLSSGTAPVRHLPWTAVNMTARHASGREIAVEVSLTEHMHGGERHITGIVRDVSERLRLSAQLLQAQKMEAVGRLTGGIAHDFNNLLTAINGYAEISLPQLDRTDPVYARLNDIRRAAERASDLTRKLLAFSRHQPVQSRRFDLSRLLADLGPILKRLIGEDIRVTIAPAAQPLPIHADPGQVDSALMNLAVNARDAMPTGGRLTLTTELIILDEIAASRHPQRRPGRFACVRVADTGTGIAAKDLPHIFEPFFTTKDAERGTGLGLAITYGVAQQHGGWIEVDSTLGRGSVFSLWLPLADSVDEAGQRPLAAVLPGGAETILLVEDEEPVRLILSEALSSVGYTVIEAASGPEALASWERHAASIQLALCDVVLPDGISGFDLAVRLTDIKPALRVILMSGYQEHSSAPPGAMFLAKPFSLEHLLGTVRMLLDTTGPERP